MRNRFTALIIGILIGAALIYFLRPNPPGWGAGGKSQTQTAASATSAPVAPAGGTPAAPAQAVVASGNTLALVKQRGYLKCGVSQGLPGFSNADDKGQWAGIDVDTCRAVAAAIFGDTSKVRYSPLSAKERFTALQSGEIDVLTRNTTVTLTRDTSLGLDFTAVNYFDGQGFLVKKESGITGIAGLNGATICLQTGTTTELNVADYFRTHNLTYQIVAFDRNDEALAAYDQGRCDALTTDASGLYAERLELKDPTAHIILPDLISKEPLATTVRQGDDQWEDIVRWSFYAMLDAEEFGLTSVNIDDGKSSTNPEIRRFLGLDGAYGAMLGLSNDWAYNIVKQVGNYGEVFERNLGMGSPLGIPRGLNAQWNKGGLMYGMPIR